MAATSIKLRSGLAPPDLGTYPVDVRRQYWAWVAEIALGVKDRELAQGLARDGEPLAAVSPRTRKYRRSAMTASGKGDPSAPYLMPARALSRTRSLLTSRSVNDGAELFWRFDAWTGESWGRILAIHARRGERYNVIGISPQGMTRLRNLAWKRWADWKAGRYTPEPARPRVSAGIPRVGTYDTSKATFGIGATGPPAGERTGGMTWPQWRRYFRQPNPVNVAIPGRPTGTYNRLLAHVWGQAAQPSKPAAKPAPGPPEPSRPKALALPELAARVLAAARSVPMADRPADNKVWIIDAYDRVGAGLSLAEFKARLWEAHQAGLVRLGRYDLPQALTPAQRVREQASELAAGVATFHYLRV